MCIGDKLALVAVLCGLIPFSVEAVKVGRQEGPVASLTGTNRNSRVSKATTSEDLLKNLSDDDVFLQVGTDDRLTWGMLRTYIDAGLGTKLNALLSAASGDSMNGIRFGIYQQALSKTLRRYLESAVIAHEARRIGMKVPASDFEEQVAKLKKKTPQPSRFQYQHLTNAVYQMAYTEKYLKPNIKVPDAAVTNLIALRHAANLAVPATNRLLRLKIDSMREKLVKKEISFSELAEEESDCTACCSNGGDCGTWDEDDESIAPNLLKVCFSLPTNTLSEVVETPDAFHLVMIASKYVPTKKAREEDGEVSSVDVRHIQIDKRTTDPEFTRQTAHEFIEQRLIARARTVKFMELLDKTPIKSVIPLTAKDPDAKAEKVRKVMEAARREVRTR